MIQILRWLQEEVVPARRDDPPVLRWQAYLLTALMLVVLFSCGMVIIEGGVK